MPRTYVTVSIHASQLDKFKNIIENMNTLNKGKGGIFIQKIEKIIAEPKDGKDG